MSTQLSKFLTLLCLIFICAFSNLNAQIKKDTTYYSNKKSILSISTTNGEIKQIVTYNYDGLIISETNLKNSKQEGIQKKWHNSGVLKSESLYQNGLILKENTWYSNGLEEYVTTYQIFKKDTSYFSQLHGNYVWYYQSGFVRIKGKYFEGLKQGLWTEYYESGIKKSEINYDKDIKKGQSKFWFNTGKIQSIQNWIPDTSKTKNR
ncbi:MAG: hypothetical protein IT245_08645, partial [Bacteroidia bacterium]|nr:hypothetical protein [Bacteroidia bacterium]